MSEKREIARMGGKAQKNSGRGILEKGDAVLEPFLVDIKEYNESFSVSRTNWAKLASDAWRSGQRVPAFMLSLGSEEETNRLRLWVIPDSMFREMRDTWLDKYGEV